jgi:beta-glucosidase
MKYCFLSFLFFVCVFKITAQKKTIGQRVDSVLKLMTLEEKIGQLNQYSGDWSYTGPVTVDNTKIQQLKEGKLGSMLNVYGVEKLHYYNSTPFSQD